MWFISAFVAFLCLCSITSAIEHNSKISLNALDYKQIDLQCLNVAQGSYISKTGLWGNILKWQSAIALNALIDYSINTGTNQFTGVIENTFKTNQVFNDEGVDDEGWWGLSWARAYKLTNDTKYLRLSEAVFKDMANYYDNKCNGGIWWDRARTYKNAVTNELFFAMASTLYLETKSQTYLDWAKKQWAWFESSGLINSQHLINDGLSTNNCQNNGQTTWTYNQGVVLGGLANLWIATKNDTLLTVARTIVSATFKNLVYGDGILRETCEIPKNCNNDQKAFKGIFMRNLGYLYSVTKDANIATIIQNNANSVWNRARDGNNNIGIYWEGPFVLGDASTQSSACELLNAAILTQ